MDQQQAKQLMAIPGNVVGESLRTDFAYINDRQGDEGVVKIENALADLGYSIKYNEIKSLQWYPEAYSVVIYLLCMDLFNWSEEDIFEMGRSAPRISIIVVKLLLKYLVSIERLMKTAGNYWRKYYDFGDVEVVEVDQKKKYLIFRIVGYNFHPIACSYQRGYFLGIISLVVSSPNLSIEEIKCIHQGDPYHEYLVKW
jgi:predicted hydrocarbon binding protein